MRIIRVRLFSARIVTRSFLLAQISTSHRRCHHPLCFRRVVLRTLSIIPPLQVRLSGIVHYLHTHYTVRVIPGIGLTNVPPPAFFGLVNHCTHGRKSMVVNAKIPPTADLPSSYDRRFKLGVRSFDGMEKGRMTFYRVVDSTPTNQS